MPSVSRLSGSLSLTLAQAIESDRLSLGKNLIVPCIIDIPLLRCRAGRAPNREFVRNFGQIYGGSTIIMLAVASAETLDVGGLLALAKYREGCRFSLQVPAG